MRLISKCVWFVMKKTVGFDIESCVNCKSYSYNIIYKENIFISLSDSEI